MFVNFFSSSYMINGFYNLSTVCELICNVTTLCEPFHLPPLWRLPSDTQNLLPAAQLFVASAWLIIINLKYILQLFHKFDESWELAADHFLTKSLFWPIINSTQCVKLLTGHFKNEWDTQIAILYAFQQTSEWDIRPGFSHAESKCHCCTCTVNETKLISAAIIAWIQSKRHAGPSFLRAENPNYYANTEWLVGPSYPHAECRHYLCVQYDIKTLTQQRTFS
jgi:hypothetical protein